MMHNVAYVALLIPLFDSYEKEMRGASETSLKVFRARCCERDVPQDVVSQLTDFYSVIDGIPCLNSLDIHCCADLILFEWWDQRELWLGQRDFYSLRWSSSKSRFCIGDAENVSLSESDEYRTFDEALRHMVRMYDSQEEPNP
jgi:hypothetical protein